METLTIEEYKEKYPYLKDMEKHTIFTSKEDINNLKNSEKVEVNGAKVIVEFLKRMLRDDSYYDYAVRFFTNEISSFNLCYIIGGDISGNISYNKVDIIYALEQLVAENKINLSSKDKERFEFLKNNITFEKFKEDYKDKIFEISIEGKDYRIPVSQIIDFMQTNEIEFNRLCISDDIKEIYGIPKTYFIYAAYMYFLENPHFDNYLLSQVVTDRFNDFDMHQKIDIQAINRLLETKDELYKTIELDDRLITAVMSGLPIDASDLEKSIYIYIKLCKILTYDDEYYALNQRGPATNKHRDINYIRTINPFNNKVVCFEFNLIYSKFLDMLGLKFISDYKNMIFEGYGSTHAHLMFRSGKFLVTADSVVSILEGDIARAKTNNSILGLRCLNMCLNTQIEFRHALYKMYNLIISQEGLNNNTQDEKTFKEMLEEYRYVTQNLKNIDIKERLSMLIEKANSTKIVGIDSLSHLLNLRRILFDVNERNDNVKISIIRNNQPLDFNSVAMASAIFAINKNGFDNCPDETIYYLYFPGYDLMPISKEDLQKNFNTSLYQYIEPKDPRVPGISEPGSKRHY